MSFNLCSGLACTAYPSALGLVAFDIELVLRFVRVLVLPVMIILNSFGVFSAKPMKTPDFTADFRVYVDPF